jgi:hypothetical protein
MLYTLIKQHADVPVYLPAFRAMIPNSQSGCLFIQNIPCLQKGEGATLQRWPCEAGRRLTHISKGKPITTIFIY